MKREKSGLLELLNENRAWDRPPHKLPQVDSRKMEEALHMHARASNSDPHAYSRMRLYIVAGFELPSDVLRTSRSIVMLREREPRQVREALEPVKKRLDEDRAWNQFHSKQYMEAAE